MQRRHRAASLWREPFVFSFYLFFFLFMVDLARCLSAFKRVCDSSYLLHAHCNRLVNCYSLYRRLRECCL